MWTTSWLLILIATTGGQMYMEPDEHSPFGTQSSCDDHAVSAINDASNRFPSRTMFRHICVPFEIESV